MGWSKPWRYTDPAGDGWPGGSEIVAVATFARDLAPAARAIADTVGTPTHTALEYLVRTLIDPDTAGPPPRVPTHPRVVCAVAGGMTWIADAMAQGWQPLAAERQIWCHVHGYVGTLDSLWRMPDGGVAIIDWKTSGSPDTWRKLMPKYRVQAALYAELLQHQPPDPDMLPQPTHMGMVRLNSAADDGPHATEYIYTVAEQRPYRTMGRAYIRAFWARAAAAHNDGDLRLHGMDVPTLRPVPRRYAGLLTTKT